MWGSSVTPGLLPGHDGWALSKIDQADPVGYQGRLLLTLDFDADIGARHQFRRLAQLRFHQREAATDPRSRAHWRDKAQLVEAVIESHRGALDHRHHLVGHDAHQRHRQESMRYRRAIRGFAFGALGIDMDELVIFDHTGKRVDPVLIDKMP